MVSKTCHMSTRWVNKWRKGERSIPELHPELKHVMQSLYMLTFSYSRLDSSHNGTQLVTGRNMVEENVGINCKGGNVEIDYAGKISTSTS